MSSAERLPLLSVITITFKDPEGLAETIRSLEPCLGRSFAWEHVVVDSSPDLNATVLKAVPAGWPLRHVVQEPRGIYGAMNEGVAQSRGELIWFLNGKDLLAEAEVLERIVRRMAADPSLDIVAAAVDRVRDGQYQFRWSPGPSFFKSTLGGCGVCHQGMIYRRSSFNRVGPYKTEYRMSADYHHHLRCLIAGLRIETTDERLARFDVSGVGATGYRKEFQELRQIHAELAPQQPSSVRRLHWMYRQAHVARVLALKKAQALPVAEVLRPIWLKWKRRNDPGFRAQSRG
jgi:glycosyltransferase involved in cell wall biosynthesis